MRKFVPMLLLLTTATIILAGDDGPVTWIALGLSAVAFGWNIYTQVIGARPRLTLAIENRRNDFRPENGNPYCDVLYLYIHFASGLVVFKDGYPMLIDNKGTELSWLPPSPEDFQTSYEKSPVKIRIEELAVEHQSEKIRAEIRFEGRRFTFKSNKLNCDSLVKKVHGVRRRKVNESNEPTLADRLRTNSLL